MRAYLGMLGLAYESLIMRGGSAHQSSWVGIASMDGSEDSLYRAHSSASASQYSNSRFASWARSRHMVSKAENRFLESTRGPRIDSKNCNPLERAGYLPFCNRLDSFVSVCDAATRLLIGLAATKAGPILRVLTLGAHRQ